MSDNDIGNATVSFMIETGKEPTKLYLGWRTKRDLTDSVAPYMIPTPVNTKRMTYQGLSVYVVDEPEYIAVGI